jgi:hypothetical protein
MGDSIRLDGELEWGATPKVWSVLLVCSGRGKDLLRMLRSLIHVLLMNSFGSSVTKWSICVTMLDLIPTP